MTATDVVKVVRARDLAALKKVEAKLIGHPQVLGELGRIAWVAGMKVTGQRGVNWNQMWRNYLPLHAAIQEDPHHAGGTSAEREEAVHWLVANGADVEAQAAWPPARAILIACFTGVRAYVDALLGVCQQDGFVWSALGDVARVKKLLRKDPGFAVARGDGGLTALMVACASRMDGAASLELTKLLLQAGAEVGATTPGWRHVTDAIYYSAGAGHKEIFRLLLEAGADATGALLPAMWNEDLEYGEMCLAYGGKLDLAREGEKPLLNEMIRWGRVKQALWMLEHGASAELADERGWTARDQAESRGNRRMIEAVQKARGRRPT
jgi:hypothetical protein